jgi:hypothetical protein
MSDKYVVPEEGLKAAIDAAGQTVKGCPWQEIVSTALEAFIRWQSENPPVPTNGQIESMRDHIGSQTSWIAEVRAICREWVRRMYLAPEPTVPDFDHVKRFVLDFNGIPTGDEMVLASNYDKLLNAYRRGQKAGKL